MSISGVSGVQLSVQVNRQEAEDSVIKSAQSRIEELRKQMRELSENEELDAKAKTEKKQELQKQISELQAQIRQRKMELNEQKRQPDERAKKVQAEKQAEREAQLQVKTGINVKGFSKSSVNAFLSADNAFDLSQVYGSVSSTLNGRARELQAELNADGSRGAAAEEKQEQLAGIKERGEKAKVFQAKSLGKAAEELNNEEKIRCEAEKKAENTEFERPEDKDREFDDWA